MFSKKVPKEFWDYGMRWICEIQQRTQMRTHRMDGGVTLENITGETEEISDYLDFGFYDRVWFHENAGLGKRGLSCWLGVSHCTGGTISYCIFKKRWLHCIMNHCAKNYKHGTRDFREAVNVLRV